MSQNYEPNGDRKCDPADRDDADLQDIPPEKCPMCLERFNEWEHAQGFVYGNATNGLQSFLVTVTHCPKCGESQKVGIE